MKSRPILFTGEMVRALLAGTKTQTRRIVKHEICANGYRYDKVSGHVSCYSDYLSPGDNVIRIKDDGLVCTFHISEAPAFCPYGHVGDQLWVREAWDFIGTNMNRHGRTHSVQDGVVRYQADNTQLTIETAWNNVELWMARKPGGKPSIHMPRWASRITLEITDVRVQRLQEISEEDAKDEGVAETIHSAGWDYERPWACGYRALWESINGPGSWALNPWVWALTFRRVTPCTP
jgi:hypothetical protein